MELSRSLVVLPGGRAGRRLKEILLERAESERRPLRPPDVTTVGGLPERLYTPSLPPPGGALTHQAWALALRETDAESLSALVPERAGGGGAQGAPASLARTIQALHHEVAATGRDFRSVAGACRGGFHFNDERRWLVLARIQERYREILAEHRRMDPATARAEALKTGRVSCPLEVWVVGAPDLPPVARGLLAELGRSEPVRILVAAPEGLADRFDALGCVLPDAWTDATVDVPDGQVELAAGPGEQADAVARRLAAFAEDVPAEEVTLGVPDPEVVPYVVERLEERAVRVRDARGVPLARTGAFRLLDALARYLESSELEALAGLVRHPAFEREALRSMAGRPRELGGLLDRYQSVHLQDALDRHALPSGGERVSDALQPGVRSLLDALSKLLAPLAGERRLSVWAPRIGEFLAALFEQHGTQGGRGERRRETDALAEGIAAVLAEFQALPRSLDPSVPAHRALRLALDEVREMVVPPDTGEEAVELLGWLELALDDATEMIVAGFNDPHVPASVTSHPFLPHGLRERIGLLDNRSRWARDLLVLRTLLATRERIALVAGRRTALGDPQLPSRLLFATDAETVARRVLGLLDVEGEEEREAGSSEVERAAPRPEEEGRASAFRLPPEPELSSPSPPRRLRVTAFRRILSDPYKYALEDVLDLNRIDDEAREMDGGVFGSLAHEVVKRFGESSARHSSDEREIRSALSEILADETRDRFGTGPLPAVRLQVAQLGARLRAFAREQARWVGEGWVIRRVEVSPPGEGTPFDVDGEPILLRARLDRIDENVRTGAWCVLDYKTGEAGPPAGSHRAGRPPRWVDLQLPLYRLLASSVANDDGEPLIPREALSGLGVGYVLLPRDLGEVGVSLAEWSGADYAEAEEEARRVVRFLRENRFVFEPGRSAIRADDPLAAVVGRGVLTVGDSGGSEGAPHV